MIPLDKIDLRKQLRGQRKSCSPFFIRQASERIMQKLLPYLEDRGCIGIYVSDGFEVDTHGIIEWCLKKGKRVAVPLVKEAFAMEFVEIASFEDLAVGHYGLLEPVRGKCVEEADLECIIIPMVGFNSQGYRIGQGGGYYDRYLKVYSGLKIGLAYRFQYCEFNEDKFDVACDVILTE